MDDTGKDGFGGERELEEEFKAEDMFCEQPEVQQGTSEASGLVCEHKKQGDTDNFSECKPGDQDGSQDHKVDGVNNHGGCAARMEKPEEKQEGRRATVQYLQDMVLINDVDEAIWLVQQGVCPVREYSTTLWDSPLHLACRRGMLDFIMAIPDIHRYVNTSHTVTDTGDSAGQILHQYTPMESALQFCAGINSPSFSKVHNSLSSMSHNLYRSDIRERESSKEYFKICQSVLKYLLANGAKATGNTQVSSAHSAKGNLTALHVACYPPGDLKLASMLIEAGADINVTSSKFSSPMHFACLPPINIPLVRTLLNHGADVNLMDENCLTPFIVALGSQGPFGEFSEYLELLREMVRHGADTGLFSMNGHRFPSHVRRYQNISTAKLFSLQILLDISWDKNNLGNSAYNKRGINSYLADLGRGDQDHEMAAMVLSKEPVLRQFLNVLDFPGKILPIFRAVRSNIKTAVVFMKHGALVNVASDYLTSSVVGIGMDTVLRTPTSNMTSEDIQDINQLAVEAYNRGFLSKIFHRVFVRDTHTIWITESCFEECWMPLTQLVYDLGTHFVWFSHDKHRHPWLEDFVHVMCENDLLLSVKMQTGNFITEKCMGSCLQRLVEMKERPSCTDMLVAFLTELQTEVISLKRLCRSYLRVYLSTIHGQRRDAFDLRHLSTQLPIDFRTQQSIPIHNMYA